MGRLRFSVSSTAGAWSRRTTETDIAPAVVHGKLEGPIAVFTVRYVIPVGSAMYTAALSGIDLPALGLVTSATVSSNGIAHPLGILPVEEAANKFGALADVEDGVVTGRDKTNAVTITMIGSCECRKALDRNAQLKPGTRLLLYACWIGNHCSFRPRK